MNKSELVSIVMKKTGLNKKSTEKAVDSILTCIEEALARGEKVQLTGFGTFDVRERAERIGRNPQTGEEIKIEAAKIPVFKAGKALKEAVSI
jgi:DNA-binding protein HU-beta